jgi:hypothetical protein
MQADPGQLAILKDLLHDFALSTGLKVNFHKSCLIPINVPDQKVQELTQVLGCVRGQFPFPYLGLPMGTTKPQVKDFAPLICRIERKLSASSMFLNYAGRLQLVNSVISSLPTYFMCSLKLPVTVVEMIDKFRKRCLWRGSDLNSKGYNLAAWDKVIVPKNKGGLSVKTYLFRMKPCSSSICTNFIIELQFLGFSLSETLITQTKSLICLHPKAPSGGRTSL